MDFVISVNSVFRIFNTEITGDTEFAEKKIRDETQMPHLQS